MRARRERRNDVPLNLSGQSLLVGNVFCGHCYNRLVLSTSGRKRIRKDGTIYRDTRSRYSCHYRARHPDRCNGQAGYGVKKLDGIIEQAIRDQLNSICALSQREFEARYHSGAIIQAQKRFIKVNTELAAKKRELEDYQDEVIRVIRGESKLSQQMLNDLITKAQSEMAELREIMDDAKQEWDHCRTNTISGTKEFTRLHAWTDTFGSASFDEKKMIISQLVKSAYVCSDYSIRLEFNISLDNFRYMSISGESGGIENTQVVSRE